jgi:hypothetical protein
MTFFLSGALLQPETAFLVWVLTTLGSREGTAPAADPDADPGAAPDADPGADRAIGSGGPRDPRSVPAGID